MRIIEHLLSEVDEKDCRAEEVCVGLHWTLVKSRYAGMSHTYKTEKKVQIENAGNLSGRQAYELAKMSLSPEPLNASVGIAALNSLMGSEGEKGSINPFIEQNVGGKTVTIIGRFPFNSEIRDRAKTTYILEFEPEAGELPVGACDDVVPESDINIITATTLINHTLDHLLYLGRGGFNILLGPSTPMSPVLFRYGLDALAGIRVLEASEVIHSITQGVKKFKLIKGIEPVCLFRKGARRK